MEYLHQEKEHWLLNNWFNKMDLKIINWLAWLRWILQKMS